MGGWLAGVTARAVAAYLEHFDTLAAAYAPDVARSMHYLTCLGDDDNFDGCRCHTDPPTGDSTGAPP
jgi:hypothetical protein